MNQQHDQPHDQRFNHTIGSIQTRHNGSNTCSRIGCAPLDLRQHLRHYSRHQFRLGRRCRGRRRRCRGRRRLRLRRWCRRRRRSPSRPPRRRWWRRTRELADINRRRNSWRSRRAHKRPLRNPPPDIPCLLLLRRLSITVIVIHEIHTRCRRLDSRVSTSDGESCC